MAASNTHDCFREMVGRTVKGVMFDALPVGQPDLSTGTKTLIFDDGRGLTFTIAGAFWIDSTEDVKQAISEKISVLETIKRDLQDTLKLAGNQGRE